MLDRWVTATNKINSQTIVVFMFTLGVSLGVIAAHMHNLTDKAQIELFGLASALVTGGLGTLNGSSSKTTTTEITPGKSTTQTTEPPTIS